MRFAFFEMVHGGVDATIRDMQDFGLERDYMMSKTLPILREHCFKKGLTITFVDLRWGVTSEESGRGDVIKLCLEVGRFGADLESVFFPCAKPLDWPIAKQSYFGVNQLVTSFIAIVTCRKWKPVHLFSFVCLATGTVGI